MVSRKAQGLLGKRISDVGSRLAMYLLEISAAETGQTQTIHLDLSRSGDFYRIPMGRLLILEIGRYPNRLGRWLNAWSEVQPEDP